MLCLLPLLVSAWAKQAVTEEGLRHLQSLDLPWVPRLSERFTNMTIDEVKMMLGTMAIDMESIQGTEIEEKAMVTLPESYDFREAFPNCDLPVHDQANCGGCWAFGAVDAFSLRRCQAGLDTTPIQLSQEYMIDCDSHNEGCNGGYLNMAWKFLQNTGVPTAECYPFTAGEKGIGNKCSNVCTDGTSITKTYKTTGPGKRVAGISGVMSELVTGGPLEASFDVAEDFLYYSSGIYTHRWGYWIGHHAVILVGYGTTDSGVDYWIVRNSWGPSWGENGYFRIMRGRNECKFEDSFFCGPVA